MKRCTGCGSYEQDLPKLKEQNPNMLSCCPDNKYLDITPMRDLRKYIMDAIPTLKKIVNNGQLTEEHIDGIFTSLIEDIDLKYIPAEANHLKDAVQLGHQCSNILNVKAVAEQYLKTRYNNDL